MKQTTTLRCLFGLLLGILASLSWASTQAGEPATRPLPPAEARNQVDKLITVEMTVRAAKDRLEKRKEVYLDAEADFRSDQNFAVVITVAGAASLKAKGIAAPAEHFKDKKINATGTVKVVDNVPRIEIDFADQIKLVD